MSSLVGATSPTAALRLKCRNLHRLSVVRTTLNLRLAVAPSPARAVPIRLPVHLGHRFAVLPMVPHPLEWLGRQRFSAALPTSLAVKT
ncbi:MAG: hypothetical protein ACKO45_11530 [Cyanobium sp.]